MRKNSQRITNNSQQGVTLYLAMLMLSAALTTAIFVSTIFIREFKISKEVADSLKAVYVADTAVEYALYQVRASEFEFTAIDLASLSFESKSVVDADAESSLMAISNSGEYYRLPPFLCAERLNIGTSGHACEIKVVLDVKKDLNISGCPSDPIVPNCTRIISKGSYGGANRAIEIIYKNL